MLKSRWLVTDQELNEFRREFESRSGNPLSSEYMAAAQVRGFFDRSGDLIAGFIINTAQPLRYFDWLPESERKWHSGDEFKAEDFAEITCIWNKKGRIPMISASRAQIYLESVFFAVATGKPAILGGTVIEKVRDQQMHVMNRPFRSGRTNFRGNDCHYWLYYVPRNEALALMIQHVGREVFVWPTQRLAEKISAIIGKRSVRSN